MSRRFIPSTCEHKVRYKRKKWTKSFAARKSADTGEKLSAYKCGQCHGWHIGHTPGQGQPKG